jgi:porin
LGNGLTTQHRCVRFSGGVGIILMSLLLPLQQAFAAQDSAPDAPAISSDVSPPPGHGSPIHSTQRGNVSLIGQGATDLTNQLAVDAAPKDPLIESLWIDRTLSSWYDWKADLFNRHGFQFTLAYSALGQHATESRPGNKDDTAGGVFDFAGTWAALNRDSDWQGMLGFRIGDQHRLGTSVVPASFGDEIGSAWGTSLAFDNISLTAIEGWWEQRLGSKAAVRLGKLDASGVFDAGALGNPFENFMGQPYNLNNSIAFPAEGLGLIANFELNANLEIMLGVVDGNGDGSDWNFDTFFTKSEHLKLAELAWFPDTRYGKSQYHVTFWDSDDRNEGDTPSGNGYTLYAEQRFGDVVPFVRYGNSSGGAAALKNMVATGIGFYDPFGRKSDGIGIGATWGEPFGDDVREQYGVEAYYRLQLTREITVTPDFQYIKDPSNNPNEDFTVIFGVRLRVNI